MRPISVSNTRKSDASPWPQNSRSVNVGMVLRWRPISRPCRSKNSKAIIDRADFGPRIDLVAAHHHIGAGLRGRSAEPFGVLARRKNRGIAKSDASAGPALQRRIPAFGPIWVSGEPDFREHDEFGAARRGFRNIGFGPGERGFLVEEARRLLHDCHLDASRPPRTGFLPMAMSIPLRWCRSCRIILPSGRHLVLHQTVMRP